ncbi:class I SAM-dependent methyltransferase [Xanthomonas sp. XNM01]|uniref:class I SAM-dependent methyltransferase n=1 Tax=Xanthomonas sp. XNM01 TaxID=2769289 RepID=UPI0017802125|nr:class I SAM-dependent methyltransferase [Xanthomonas sp. XNM01]MBD9367412.1 class I SAM-dependent methyltransferase [Xanthomonas sp. XNM01]
MAPAHSSDASSPWSGLWRSGVLHSCATGLDGNYAGAIADFWRAQFATLEHGDRVVDIGTGNGPLALLCKAECERRGIHAEIHGVDLADIDPPARMTSLESQYDGITFHPSTPAECLPFADGSVHLLVSQFGFEYAEQTAAIREAFRVAAVRSRIALMMHTRDSIVAETSERQLESTDYLLRQTPLWELALEMARVIGTRTSPMPTPEQEAVRRRFNAAGSDLIERASTASSKRMFETVIRAVRTALMHAERGHWQEAQEQLLARRKSLEDEELRLRQMTRAALSTAQMDELRAVLRDAGFSTEASPLFERPDRCMGWTLVARRG